MKRLGFAVLKLTCAAFLYRSPRESPSVYMDREGLRCSYPSTESCINVAFVQGERYATKIVATIQEALE